MIETLLSNGHLHECYVEYTGVVVNKLKEVYFEGQAVIKFCLGSKQLELGELFGEPFVHIVQKNLKRFSLRNV